MRVSRPAALSLEELRARPAVEVTATMECAGNGRAGFSPRAFSQPWLDEAVGTGSWRGAALGPLLEECGVLDDAVEVVFTGLDRGTENGLEQDFARSLPVAEAGRDGVILAYELNGGPLPPQHGFPLRLLVPGWYGMTNVKWLSAITVVDRPFAGPQQAVSYRLKETEAEEGAPLTRMLPRALLIPPGVPEFPTRARTLPAGRHVLEGRAWSGWAPDRHRRGVNRRRARLARGGARPRRRLPVGLGRLPGRVGRGARPPRAPLPGDRRGGQRAAGRAGLEPGRLRQQRGAAPRGDRGLDGRPSNSVKPPPRERSTLQRRTREGGSGWRAS